MPQEIKTFKNLLENSQEIKIPSYQRAYAWGEIQINQFFSDLLEINGKEYYYGHFIIEEHENCFEIIDGQQRITTFVLFLLATKIHYKVDFDTDFVHSKFKTIERVNPSGLASLTINGEPKLNSSAFLSLIEY